MLEGLVRVHTFRQKGQQDGRAWGENWAGKQLARGVWLEMNLEVQARANQICMLKE